MSEAVRSWQPRDSVDLGCSLLRAYAAFVPPCSHVAQECYCGEPNCVGYIGGKTQTDLGGMDDLYIDGAHRLSTDFLRLEYTD